MADLKIYRIAFGGYAFEPVTDEGRAYCASLEGDHLFRAPDACMTGFNADSVGWEPYATTDMLDDASRAGLSFEWED